MSLDIIFSQSCLNILFLFIYITNIKVSKEFEKYTLEIFLYREKCITSFFIHIKISKLLNYTTVISMIKYCLVYYYTISNIFFTR